MVRAQDFAVDQIRADSPYTGTVTADVHVTGTLAAPMEAGKLSAADGAVGGVSFHTAAVDVSYADGLVSFQNLTAELFGGSVSGTGVFDTAHRSYTAHLAADGVSLAQLPSTGCAAKPPRAAR